MFRISINEKYQSSRFQVSTLLQLSNFQRYELLILMESSNLCDGYLYLRSQMYNVYRLVLLIFFNSLKSSDKSFSDGTTFIIISRTSYLVPLISYLLYNGIAGNKIPMEVNERLTNAERTFNEHFVNGEQSH